MRVIILSLLVLSSLSAYAGARKLKNFAPGKYTLSEGPAEKCGQGEFKMRDDTSGVLLGPFHGFSIRKNTVVLKSDIPEESGCSYDVHENVALNGSETTLTFKETLRCPAALRHVLNRTALLSAKRIQIDIEQRGNSDFEDEESFVYRCVFVKN